MTFQSVCFYRVRLGMFGRARTAALPKGDVDLARDLRCLIESVGPQERCTMAPGRCGDFLRFDTSRLEHFVTDAGTGRRRNLPLMLVY
jgi:hypothetical protein